MIRFRRRSYGISPERDDWVAPEETLVDSASRLTELEMPVGDGAFRAAQVAAVLTAAVLIGAAAWLTVDRHEELAALAWRNRTVNVSVPPPRGIIMDRSGEALVENVPSFDLLAITRQVARAGDGTVAGLTALAGHLGRDPEELTLAVTDSMRANAVFFVATDMPREQVLALRSVLPEGFYIITSTKRHYPDAQQMAHILGYVGKVSKADIASDPYYLPSDTVGRLGVEAMYEKVLRGTHGKLVLSAGQTQTQEPGPGANLVLNIDADRQRSLYKAVDGILREAGLTQASAVAQDPRSGAVLAMVSFPGYDNNVFSGPLSQEQVDELFNSRTRPLFNRAVAGKYNPGSTIKPFIGMAALQEGIVSSDTLVNHDCISISVPNPSDPERPYVFDNWRRDTGWFNLFRAIADSCNVYFYTVGGGHGNIKGLGVDRISAFLAASLADRLLGVDLPGEEPGFIPTPEWKYRTRKEPWYQGDTYNISIGQGDLLVTPLWINSYVSAVANGGTLWQPQVADRVVDDARATLADLAPKQVGALPFEPAVIRAMQTAMRQTVLSGTGRILQDIGVSAAAKTGTAEVIKGSRINSLVTVYAPADDPQVALTVLIEGSTENQGYALRAARAFLQDYFNVVE